MSDGKASSNEVDNVLVERNSMYGPSWLTANEAIKALVEGDASRLQPLLDAGMLANFVISMSKMARMVATPKYEDHLIDLIGYSELSLAHLRGYGDRYGAQRVQATEIDEDIDDSVFAYADGELDGGER